MENVNFLQFYTGWAKKVIPLLIILHCTRGITFLAHKNGSIKTIKR